MTSEQRMRIPAETKLYDLEAGDRIALFRPGRGGGIIALGTVRAGRMGDKYPWERSSAAIEFAEFFFDSPIGMSELRRQEPTRTVDFTWRPLDTFEGRPIGITKERWDVIAKLAGSRPESASSNWRWKISPGEIVRREELEEIYGCDANREISNPTELLDTFIVASLHSRVLARDPDDSDALLVWALESDAARVAVHLRQGRALRVFHSVRYSKDQVRYLGRYVVDQREPIVSTPNTPGFLDRICVRIRPLDKAHDSSLPSMDVGAGYRPEREEIEFQEKTQSGIDSLRRRLLDPASTRVHRKLQNRLADEVSQRGLTPLSPNQLDLKFDLAFRHDGSLYIVEVKSLSRDQEASQLMKGFGQVCYYAHAYRQQGEVVVPVLYVERRPPFLWESMCAEYGILMAWPECVEKVFTRDFQQLAAKASGKGAGKFHASPPRESSGGG